MFLNSASTLGAKTAMYWGDAEYSYAQFLRQSLWLGNHLADQLQINPGDRIGIWLTNRPEYIPALMGILQAGGVAVPINHFLKPSEVQYLAADSGLRALITEDSLLDSLQAVCQQLPNLKICMADEFIDGLHDREDATTPYVERSDSDLAVIIYTSGTTGRPKGAMLSHGNLNHNLESCVQALEAVDADRFALLLPMFHSFMLTVGMLLPIRVGGSIVLIKSLHPPKNIIQEIMHRQATVLPAIPQLFRALTSIPPEINLPLRLCVSGAAPLPAEILEQFTARHSLPLLEGYGLSEASPVVSFNPIRGPQKPGSVGVPVADVEVSIQDERGQEISRGEIGEICVRGGNVMQGYWKKPDETKAAIRSRWLLTGDMGYMDEDGYLFITDRKKDMLLVNGMNVYPREIEEVLYRFPGVREAAVVGRPDPRKGDQPVAFVSADTGVTLQEKAILTFLKDQLAAYKVPRQILIRPSLPRTATGKILKTELKESLN